MDTALQHDQFVERFVRTQDRIYACVATLLPNRTDAEEVFQQTSLVLWKKWQQFNPSRDFLAWACGVAHHEVRNFLRKHKDRGRVFLSEDILAEVAQVRLENTDMLDARRQALLRCLGRPPNVVYMLLKRLRRALFECVNRTLASEGLT